MKTTTSESKGARTEFFLSYRMIQKQKKSLNLKIEKAPKINRNKSEENEDS